MTRRFLYSAVLLTAVMILSSCDASMLANLASITGNTQGNILIDAGIIQPSTANVTGVKDAVDTANKTTNLSTVIGNLDLPTAITDKINMNDLQQQIDNLGYGALLKGTMLLPQTLEQQLNFSTQLSKALASPHQRKALYAVMQTPATEEVSAACKGSMLVAVAGLDAAVAYLNAESSTSYADLKNALHAFSDLLKQAIASANITNGDAVQIQLITNLVTLVGNAAVKLLDAGVTKEQIGNAILSVANQLLFMGNVSKALAGTGILNNGQMMGISDLLATYLDSMKGSN